MNKYVLSLFLGTLTIIVFIVYITQINIFKNGNESSFVMKFVMDHTNGRNIKNNEQKALKRDVRDRLVEAGHVRTGEIRKALEYRFGRIPTQREVEFTRETTVFMPEEEIKGLQRHVNLFRMMHPYCKPPDPLPGGVLYFLLKEQKQMEQQINNRGE